MLNIEIIFYIINIYINKKGEIMAIRILMLILAFILVVNLVLTLVGFFTNVNLLYLKTFANLIVKMPYYIANR